MLANHKLAKSIADLGFFEFRRQLDYKCQFYGSELIIVDRWFPSSKLCSSCGAKKEFLSLSERIYQCDSCSVAIDRDLNAAINLAQIGRAAAEFTPVEKVLPTVFVESGNKTNQDTLSRFG